jgi:hypothetical protein
MTHVNGHAEFLTNPFCQVFPVVIDVGEHPELQRTGNGHAGSQYQTGNNPQPEPETPAGKQGSQALNWHLEQLGGEREETVQEKSAKMIRALATPGIRPIDRTSA